MSNITENKINTVLSPETVSSANASIASITSLLPAGSLTDAQRNGLKSIDVDNKVFVEDVITEIGVSGAGIIPTFINPTFIHNDLTLFEQLDTLQAGVTNLLRKITDLKRICGDEAFSMALAAYKIFDAANQSGISGAKESYDKLKVRFDAQNNNAGRSNDTNAM
jgi:hypothetical protein